MNKTDFFEEYRPKLISYYAWKLKRPHQDSLVQDLTSTAIYKILKNWEAYKSERGPFDAWALTIMRNTLKDYHKKHRDINMGHDDTRIYGQLSEPDNSEKDNFLAIILQEMEAQDLHLPATALVPWVLKCLGYTYDEVAEILQLSTPTIKYRVMKCRNILWQELSPDGAAPSVPESSQSLPESD